MMKLSPVSSNTPSVTLLPDNPEGLAGDPAVPLGVKRVFLVVKCCRLHMPCTPLLVQMSSSDCGIISPSDSTSPIADTPTCFLLGLMTLCSAWSPGAFAPGVLLGLHPSRPSSRTTSSACLGSASNSTPSSVTRTILLSILTSFTSFSALPSVSVLILYFSRSAASVDARLAGSPTATKSSPWTMMATSLASWKNRHGEVLPCTNPAFLSVSPYSVAQFMAASRVPYMDTRNLPHMFSSPGSRSSSGSWT